MTTTGITGHLVKVPSDGEGVGCVGVIQRILPGVGYIQFGEQRPMSGVGFAASLFNIQIS